MWRAAPDREKWTQRRLLALLIAVGLIGVLLLMGLGLAVHRTLTAGGEHMGTAHNPAKTWDPRDELAARPLPPADAYAWHPGQLSTARSGVLTLPTARHLGEAGVATGFPKTPEGALAQLIAIDQAALQSASIPAAQAVIEAWAVEGGPTPENWSGVRAVADLLQAAGLPMSGSPTLTVSASPEMGLIKGTIGSEYVVPCVNFAVTATLAETAQVAAADCQRMQWTDGRWMVGAGTEPAQPPAVWPGTDAAHKVGYRVLRYE